MLKWMLMVIAALIVLVLLLALVGWMLPKGHSAKSRVFLMQPPETVWMVVRDFENYPSWWSNMKSVERLPDRDGREVWNHRDKHNQAMPIEVVESQPPGRLVTSIAGEGLPFGGTWTYEIVESAEGSTITITEDGEIYNPIFRVMSHLFLGYHATMDGYLKALGRKLGEEVTPVDGS